MIHVVQYETNRANFFVFDRSHAGRLELDEFKDMIASIRVEKIEPKGGRHWKCFKELPRRESFWVALSYTIAGLIYTVAAFGTYSELVTANLFVTGSSLYAAASLWGMFRIPQSFDQHLALLQTSTGRFRSSLLTQSKAYSQRYRVCSSSTIGDSTSRTSVQDEICV